MTTPQALTAFIVAAGLLTITPGLDTSLVLRTAVVEGPRKAMSGGAGICVGCLTWGFSASVGFGAVLTASRLAYDVLRVGGACYLVFLGVNILSRSQGSMLQLSDARAVAGGTTKSNAFTRGLLTNLLNPKVGVFYVSFLPLFIPPGAHVVRFGMLLATIHVLEGILWYSTLVVATRALSIWLRKPRVSKTLDRVTGCVFVGFGLKLLLDKGQ